MQEFFVSEKINGFIVSRTFNPEKLKKSELLDLLNDLRRFVRRLDMDEINPMIKELNERRAAELEASLPKKKGRPRNSDTDGAFIRRDRKAGMTFRALSEKYGLSVNTVRKICSEDASFDAAFFDLIDNPY